MKVSIVTPTLNAVSHIDSCISKLDLIDSFGFEIEHIIIDGGSVDNTVDICRKFDHVNLFEYPGSSQSEAINYGVEKHSGDIVAILNSDDYFLPNVFKDLRPILKRMQTFIFLILC